MRFLMKIFKWIIIVLIGLAVILFIASWLYYGWHYRTPDNPKPDNDNFTFIGNDNRNYYNSKACQLKDSSIVITSVLSKPKRFRDGISIIKLSPEGNFLWEKKFAFANLSFWDFVPAVIRKGKGYQFVNALNINFLDGNYYILLVRYNLKVLEPFLLKLDLNGKLLSSVKVNLKLDRYTSIKSFMQHNYAYLSYLDTMDKMICVAKLNIKTGDIINNSMLFYKQDSLYFNAITADRADTTISLTAYDKKKGCSYYMYTPTNGLEEYFRTEPSSEFTLLKYINEKLYGVVKEDSLQRIVDLTSLSKPLILFTDIPEYKYYKAKDLLIVNGDFYVCLDVINRDKHGLNKDIVINKYAKNNEKSTVYIIQGKKYENASYLFRTTDNQMLVIGNSSSMKLGRGYRVFTGKFKLWQ